MRPPVSISESVTAGSTGAAEDSAAGATLLDSRAGAIVVELDSADACSETAPLVSRRLEVVVCGPTLFRSSGETEAAATSCGSAELGLDSVCGLAVSFVSWLRESLAESVEAASGLTSELEVVVLAVVCGVVVSTDTTTAGGLVAGVDASAAFGATVGDCEGAKVEVIVSG